MKERYTKEIHEVKQLNKLSWSDSLREPHHHHFNYLAEDTSCVNNIQSSCIEPYGLRPATGAGPGPGHMQGYDLTGNHHWGLVRSLTLKDKARDDTITKAPGHVIKKLD
jgi:hypothetical protein